VAVDPSSPYTGGAILGDRIRMQAHSTDPKVFVRSMGTRGYPGGIARSASDVVRLLEAGGYPRLFLETVGVGQSEIAIMGLADTIVLVLNPGTGDGIQAIKAGIMEIADIFVVNKADLAGAKKLKREIEAVLDLNGATPWRPPVVLTSTLDGLGVSELKQHIEAHQVHLAQPGQIKPHTKQAKGEMASEVWRSLEDKLRGNFELLWPAWASQAQQSAEAPSYWADIIWSEMLKRRMNHE